MLESEKLTELLGKAETTPEIEFALDAAKDLIFGYCHIDRLPRALESTAYRMAMDILKNEGSGANSSPGSISSITEGDVSVSFDSSSASTFTNSILKDYAAQLRPYRRLTIHDRNSDY